MKHKYYIFTDCDLDGAGSYLVFEWMTGIKNIPYSVVTVNRLLPELRRWLKKNTFDEYHKVYFFDLDTNDPEIHQLIDHKNVVIFDHHDTNDGTVEYKNAKRYIDTDAGSTCRLIYDTLSKISKAKKLNLEQKSLMVLVNDYDSYELKSPISKKLNIVFWNYQGDRLEKFKRDFANGWTGGFNKFQQNAIVLSEKRLSRLKEQATLFTGECELGGSKYNVASVVATSHINDMADWAAAETGCDIALVVNTKSGKVSFRRRAGKTDFSVVEFAEQITDECGGHDAAAGGKLCEKFLNYSKSLQEFQKEVV